MVLPVMVIFEVNAELPRSFPVSWYLAARRRRYLVFEWRILPENGSGTEC